MESHTKWCLVFTKPKQESVAQINLERQGFHTYLPLLRQHKIKNDLYNVVTEPLFQRYLFVSLNSKVDDWGKIRYTRGCATLVRFGAQPAQVPAKLIEQLKSDETKRLTEPFTATPDFKPGDPVRVIGGAFANFEGIVAIKNNQQRITLLLSIAEGYTRSVSLSVHQVKAI